MKRIVTLISLLASGAAMSAPATYNVDPNHTYPSFEADHNGGLSVWRGKMKSTKGTIVLDRQAHSGTVDITVDAASVDFGNDKLSGEAKGERFFNTEKFPTATYQGKFSKFNGDVPAEVDGNLTFHGVTKPMKLTINSFLCKPSMMTKKEVCGADASGTFNRADFGVDFGQQMGFKMDVKLAIQVEANKAD